MFSVKPAKKGEELLNTYGYHLSNQRLLHGYGFCLMRDYEQDVISFFNFLFYYLFHSFFFLQKRLFD